MRALTIAVSSILWLSGAPAPASAQWQWTPEYYNNQGPALRCEFGDKDACGKFDMSPAMEQDDFFPYGTIQRPYYGRYGRIPHFGRHVYLSPYHDRVPRRILGYLYQRHAPLPHEGFFFFFSR